MPNIRFQRYRLFVQPLTSVHVGSGETIEPYEFNLIQEGNKHWVVVFDLPRMLGGMSSDQRARFYSIADAADFPALRQWLRTTARPEHERYRILILSDAYQEIRSHLDDPRRLGEIHLFTRHARTGQPYLPGSSLKGAIRTAIVDAAARLPEADGPALRQAASAASNRRNAGTQFEAIALGNLHEGRPDLYRDPLRQVAISDIPLPYEACNIDKIEIVRRGGAGREGTQGINIYRDLWDPYEGPDRRYVGELRWNGGLCEPFRRAGPSVSRPLPMEQCLKDCQAFYAERLRDELQKFRNEIDEGVLERLQGEAERSESGSCLLRLGRHSHFESVTVGPPYRCPPRRGFGKSRSYAQGVMPLGWMRLYMVPWTKP
jgi:CRISPR-associated protein Csm5